MVTKVLGDVTLLGKCQYHYINEVDQFISYYFDFINRIDINRIKNLF